GTLESFDRRVRTSADAQRATQLSVIGSVPNFRTIGDRAVSVMVVRDAFRALRTNMHFLGMRVPGVIAVTSAAPGEGKSTVAANLALALVDQGLRVLLIDADLRRPLVHKVFETTAAPGLKDVIEGTAPLDVAIRTPPLPIAGTLHNLPSGTPDDDPAKLLTSKAFALLIAQLRDLHEVIIIDTPPVLAAVDALSVVTLADSVLVLARANQTDSSALTEAVEQLRRAKVPLTGVIINAVSGSGTPYYRYREYYLNGRRSGRDQSRRPLIFSARDLPDGRTG
ncbi:MAG: CpsD/CapB family tyrosine-protein kinase, partial [Longimicrobiales bacterium]